ncbi:YidB family protein [Bradyrhizobium sp. vgs-9]|uniref:YidB family protein n=1 Tax=Bradyrhizobium TaxID=374 RepID=UPI0035D3E5FE
MVTPRLPLEHFRQDGQGDAALSWINEGPNREVTPPELRQAIGPDVLQKLEHRQACRIRRYSTAYSRASDSRGAITPDRHLPTPSA